MKRYILTYYRAEAEDIASEFRFAQGGPCPHCGAPPEKHTKELVEVFLVTGKEPLEERFALAERFKACEGPADFIATINSMVCAADLGEVDAIQIIDPKNEADPNAVRQARYRARTPRGWGDEPNPVPPS